VKRDANEATSIAAELAYKAAFSQMLAVLEELEESASYWGEYDVPVGIVYRVNKAITAAKRVME
jgi:hypothetical protein